MSERTGRDGFGQKEKRVQDEIKYRSFFGLTYVPNGKFHRKNNETRTHVYDRLDQNGGEKRDDLTGRNILDLISGGTIMYTIYIVFVVN